MRVKIYTVLDSKAEAHHQPFFAPTDGVAQRNFATACLDENHNFNQHAADYTLFAIGEFDDATGIILPETPRNLGNGLSFKASPTLTALRPAEAESA